MTNLELLLDRNQRFMRSYVPLPFGGPAAGLIVLGCLDHRVDPAHVLGLELGDAMVIRNVGGRVTPAVIEDIAFVSYIAEQFFGSTGDPSSILFEVAVLQHTQCGAGLAADSEFVQSMAAATSVPRAALAERAIGDIEETVKIDVQRLRDSPILPARVSVSGHLYDVESGQVRTILPALVAEGL